ncbi:hypothetical protein ACFFV7_16075 [Nonomuraea spiralis]|uniref:Uncharacterized protein n=1 Tax=Nonomuraea spiralis TaxID=46182 RepID=A0ABV5IFM5_9ACTN|nr:hypothetical protein [Nonomuraea spiralis]GGT30697.1 hypothetical protein GCM10010176_089150 [Nonomuraea spiralis]
MTKACPSRPSPIPSGTRAQRHRDDRTIRTPPEQLTQLIAAREPYWPKLKQGADALGAKDKFRQDPTS